LRRTLAYYWRINLAVASGAAVACAVLAGALLVGDSVRGSLRDLTLERLGRIDHALVAPHFFREALAADLAAESGFAGALQAPVPLIVLRGSATHADSGARASGVGIHGVDDSFAALFDTRLDLERAAGQALPPVIVNESLRRELGAAVGDDVLLRFGRWSEVPRETLLGDKDPEDVLGSLRLTIAAVVPDRGLGRFGLTPSQQTPANAFLSLARLQRALDLRGRINGILVGQPTAGEGLAAALARAIEIEDLGLVLLRHPDHLALESREYVLRPEVERVAVELAAELGAPFLVTQAYLANEIRLGQRAIPYSMVAALDPLGASGWAGLALADGRPAPVPGADGIILGEWAAGELGAAVGDPLTVTYYVVGSREEFSESQATFRVEGIAAMADLGTDRRLTPAVPGIQDAEDISAWDPPFPIDLGRIRSEDELYWDQYGPAPKAFVAEATGRKLWTTRFGSATALRIGAAPGQRLEQIEERFRAGLVQRLGPASSGLSFEPVKRRGLRAAAGATDFGMLFLSFSLFLIASAALLIGLLFRLGVERRAKEIGLLLAVGHPVASVRGRLLAEAAWLTALGGSLGLAGAVGFAGLMMAGLRTVWRPAVGSSELYLHLAPASLAIGWTGTLAVVLVSVALAVRKLVRLPPPTLLAGTTARQDGRAAGRASLWVAWGGLAGAAGLLGAAVAQGSVESPGSTFGAGSLLLVAGLAGFSRWCRGSRHRHLARSLAGMAARNSSWSPGRSMLSVALVGSACFMIVVVEVFRVEPGQPLESRDSGAGGFSLVARSDVPLLQDLNRPEQLLELGFSPEAAAELRNAAVFPARLLPGDDASCRNLYRPERPALLGLPREFTARGGFRFRGLLGAADRDDPWELLDRRFEDGVVPAFTDANSAQWILHMKLGDELVMDDELGRPLRLRLAGMLERSIFRSELLIAEERLLEHFPGTTGYSYFLIDAAAEDAPAVSRVLESALEAFGFDVTTARDRIAGYEAVQNTYLSTFQLLGGLGLLLGTAGLGLVLARNVIERRRELATLRAFGFRRSRLAWIVLAENAFLLGLGVLLGSLAALAAVAPGLSGRSPAWLTLGSTLGLVFAIGMLSSIAALAGTLRVPLLPSLKAER